MAEEIGFENGRNSNFQALVTLTLTLDPAIRHTVVHHSSTSTYIPNFIQIEETFCGRTDVRTDGHFPPLILLGLLLEVDLKIPVWQKECTKFDQLIFRKIIKIVATICQILTLKCTKIDFGCPRSCWGSLQLLRLDITPGHC